MFNIKTIYESDTLSNIILKDGDNWRNNLMNYVDEIINEQGEDEDNAHK